MINFLSGVVKLTQVLLSRESKIIVANAWLMSNFTINLSASGDNPTSFFPDRRIFPNTY